MNKISGILMLLIYVGVASTLLNDRFVGEDNLRNLLRWSSMYAVFGIGVAFVIITGGIDLSIGSTIGLLGCVLQMVLVQYKWSVGASLGTVMLAAIAIGLAHGLLITKMRLQPFVVTLCGLLIYRGLARWMTRDASTGFGTTYDHSLRLLATGAPCSAAFVVMAAGILVAIWFSVRAVTGIWQPVEFRKTRESLLGSLLGVALAVIGSSRFWYGYTIERGQDVPVFFQLSLPTWHTRVPEEAIRLPGELMWWSGLLAVPFGLWFIVSAIRKQSRFLGVVALQLMIVVACLPLVLVGTEELLSRLGMPGALPFGELGMARWHMGEVFLALGVIMATLAWFFRSGLKAGGPTARLPAMATGVTAIMWLLGKSQLAHEWLSNLGADAAVGFAGKTRLLEVLVPAPFFVLLLLAVVSAMFLNLTIYGRYLLAVGRNEQAARFSGIRTDRMIILAYVLCSAIAGLGAIVFTLDGNAVQPAGHGSGYELNAIAAAVLGGCSLRGGEGSILGVVIGATVMRAIINSCGLVGVAPQLEQAIIGLVILLGTLADEIVRRLAVRRRAAEQAAAMKSKMV